MPVEQASKLLRVLSDELSKEEFEDIIPGLAFNLGLVSTQDLLDDRNLRHPPSAARSLRRLNTKAAKPFGHKKKIDPHFLLHQQMKDDADKQDTTEE